MKYYSIAEKLNSDYPRYQNLVENASNDIFSTRFNAIWNGNYQEVEKLGFAMDFQGEMVPYDYESLKKDKQYLYILNSLKNQLYWYVNRTMKHLRLRAEKLLNNIEKEL